MLTITPIPCLSDNYAYLIADHDSGQAWLVDASEAEAPRAALDRHPRLVLRGILCTHHHWDHTGGNEPLTTGAEVWVAGHASDAGRIPAQTVFEDAPTHRFVPSSVSLAGIRLAAMHIPGHTTGAIAWRIPAGATGPGSPAHIFTGDTLFAAGCGRLFEGTAAQMHGSLQALTEGPDDTRLWFGHEYTAANLRFAAVAEPNNLAVVERARGLSPSTTPTTIALERATNPFVRAHGWQELAARRSAKDGFAG